MLITDEKIIFHNKNFRRYLKEGFPKEVIIMYIEIYQIVKTKKFTMKALADNYKTTVSRLSTFNSRAINFLEFQSHTVQLKEFIKNVFESQKGELIMKKSANLIIKGSVEEFNKEEVNNLITQYHLPKAFKFKDDDIAISFDLIDSIDKHSWLKDMIPDVDIPVSLIFPIAIIPLRILKQYNSYDKESFTMYHEFYKEISIVVSIDKTAKEKINAF